MVTLPSKAKFAYDPMQGAATWQIEWHDSTARGLTRECHPK